MSKKAGLDKSRYLCYDFCMKTFKDRMRKKD